MMLLDCESVDSTYRSLERILGISENELRKFLAEIDLDTYYESNPKEHRLGSELLFDLITGGHEKRANFYTCWFHLTRSVRNHTFERGMLPLGNQVDSIWATLYGITENLTKKDWSEFREQIENPNLNGSRDFNHFSKLYRSKLANDYLWGPYAVLVRESGFRPQESRSHDYLKVPEIVEDICICYKELYGQNLLEAYYEYTEPCIVKFVERRACNGCLIPALYYLYVDLHQENLSDIANTCYDGKGKTVPADAIVKIEFPEYTF